MGCGTRVYVLHDTKRHHQLRRRNLLHLLTIKGESIYMIQVRELTKFYGKKAVVENVSVNIHPGKITSFIGPNGAGKSTLLSMVSRLLDADTGEVLVDKQDVKKMKSNDFSKRVSILKQSNFMNVRLTIRELVSFGRYPHSRGRLNAEDLRIVDQAIGLYGT